MNSLAHSKMRLPLSINGSLRFGRFYRRKELRKRSKIATVVLAEPGPLYQATDSNCLLVPQNSHSISSVPISYVCPQGGSHDTPRNKITRAMLVEGGRAEPSLQSHFSKDALF